MFEIDFFRTSDLRSTEERREKIAHFVANPSARADFLDYGYNYYDNADYGIGYGGYYYDGRYADNVNKVITHYSLKPGSTVLDIGCAKGFILFEFLKHGMVVAGIDLSSYALQNAKSEVKPYLVKGTCESLPWPSNSFDLVYSKDTLPHLTELQLRKVLTEVDRVSKSSNIFYEIPVGNTKQQRELIKAWDETHQCIKSTTWWKEYLNEMGFHGQVCFKNLF